VRIFSTFFLKEVIFILASPTLCFSN